MSPELARRLLAVEADAQRLPWAKERAWRVDTHVSVSGPWLEVDLHDLSVTLALDVLHANTDHGPPCVRLITGRGKHTGGQSRLREAVYDAARAAGWRVAAVGPGRLELVRQGSIRPRDRASQLLYFVVALLIVAAVLAGVWKRM